MTLEEMGHKLGVNWKWNEYRGLWHLTVGQATLEVAPRAAGTWVVVRDHGLKGWTHDWPCASFQQAVDVAHLLVAAERVSEGAAVAELSVVGSGSFQNGCVWVGSANTISTPDARRHALDVLRVADQAEGLL